MFEKVNPAHPDKIADRIAGAIVDLAYNENANPKIAVEVLIGHGMCNIAAESSVHISATDILEAVSRIAGDVVVNYHEVAQDPILARNQANAVRCGDNGIFRGVPVTDEQRALAEIAREIADITIAADDLMELVQLKKLSNSMMKRINRNYRLIVAINGSLIGLGVAGVIQPATSALLHNTSTLMIGLESMRNLLPEE